ncbi:MAG TPA: hypothetical protein EYP63_05330 [Desulfotomaculum sp.]|nr:hypothetical protein [Desulfotomaculum sp.]
MSKIPQFQSAEEEAAFWETHAVTDYLDELKEETQEIEIAAPKIKKIPVTIRLDEDALQAVKDVAQSLRIPYQTLIRMWLVEALKKRHPETLQRYTAGK